MVTSAQVVTDRETGRSRGFGFVEMGDDDARKAIDELIGRSSAAGRSPSTKHAPEHPRPPRATPPLLIRLRLVMAPVSAPLTSLAYLPRTPLV